MFLFTHNIMKYFVNLLALLIILVPLETEAQPLSFPGNDHVKAHLISDSKTSALRIGVLFTIEPGWHIYWRNPGDYGLATEITWTLPKGWRASELLWPVPEKIEELGKITSFGYRDEVLLMAELVGKDKGNKRLPISAKVDWLVCKEQCLLGSKTLATKFSLSESPFADHTIFRRYDALTPKPWHSLINNPVFSDAKLIPILSHNTLMYGSPLTAALHLKGLSKEKLQAPASHIQLFPYSVDGIKIGIPEVAVLSSAAPELLITFSLEVSEEKAFGSSIQGILAFSEEFAETTPLAASTWALPIPALKEQGGLEKNPDFETLMSNASESTPLSFRFVPFSGEQSWAQGITTPNQTSFWRLLIAIASAFLGGLLLNLMPCVLPIISIKVMGFLSYSEQPRRYALLSAAAFSLGIIVTFLLLALVVVILRAAGYELGWGFQFQEPGFVIALLLIIFVLSLGFFDLYAFSLPFLNNVSASVSKVSVPYFKSFFEGVLATLLSTPCTAPFLGTALVVAFTQPAAVTFAIFFSVGLGLSLPYVCLSASPKLLSLLPKPGPWMKRLRQIMGLALLGTCAWLLFVLHALTAQGSQTYASSRIAWQPYSEKLLSEAQENQKAIFIDFTAKWCLTCQYNESTAIETQGIASALKSYNILPIKADWTTGDKAVTTALKRFGGQGVPHYVVITWDGVPLVLPTLVSERDLITAFEKAAQTEN